MAFQSRSWLTPLARAVRTIARTAAF